MRCNSCGTEKTGRAGKNGECLPGGWKEHQDRPWCERCWSAHWKLRAITIPVAGPVDGTWEELREALHTAWGNSTRLSNWATSEMYKADVVRTPEMVRLPKYPGAYLYPGARALVPEMDTRSVIAVLHAVEGKYRKRRLDVVWRNAESLPNFRYPVPYPVHNQGWSAQQGEDGEALISVRLAGRRWLLRLRGGHEFRRQLAAHADAARGVAKLGELALYAGPVQASGHRTGVPVRTAGGGRSKVGRVLVKMVLWLPKEDGKARNGTLYCRTDRESFWVYHVNTDGEIKRLNADHVRRWIAEHRRRLQRTSEDLKHEKRWPKAVRNRMVEAREPWVEKARNRLKTWCHQATAMLIGFADRQNVATVMYDDSCKSFADSFPWDMLRTQLEYKLDEKGIALSIVKPAEAPVGNGD